jgi:hypothetical protein
MIVLMSPEDNLMIQHAQALAQTYYGDEKENIVHFKDNCFNTLIASGKKDLRVTFAGHAGKNSYGEKQLNPLQFFTWLEKNNFPFDRVTSIDLFGCEIGLFYQDDTLTSQTSYAHIFAAYIHKKHPGIIVKAFTNLITEAELYAMYLNFYNTNSLTYITGITKSSREALAAELAAEINNHIPYYHDLLEFKSALSELKVSTDKLFTDPSTIHACLMQVFKLQMMNTTFDPELKTHIDALHKTIENTIDLVQSSKMTPQISTQISQSLNRTVSEIDKILNRQDSLVRLLTTSIHKYFNEKHTTRFSASQQTRVGLDSNPSFVINQTTLNTFNRLDKSHQIVWSIINNKISDLTLDKKNSQTSSSIASLIKIRNQVDDEKTYLSDTIDALLKTNLITDAETTMKLLTLSLDGKMSESNAPVFDKIKTLLLLNRAIKDGLPIECKRLVILLKNTGEEKILSQFDHEERLPLWRALQTGNQKIITAMIGAYADAKVDIQSQLIKHTPLTKTTLAHLAVMDDKGISILDFINKYAQKEALNQPNEFGFTPAYEAAINGNLLAFQKLASLEVDMDVPKNHLPAVAVIKSILNNTIKPDQISLFVSALAKAKGDFLQVDASGISAMSEVIKNQRWDILTLILQVMDENTKLNAGLTNATPPEQSALAKAAKANQWETVMHISLIPGNLRDLPKNDREYILNNRAQLLLHFSAYLDKQSDTKKTELLNRIESQNLLLGSILMAPTAASHLLFQPAAFSGEFEIKKLYAKINSSKTDLKP